ncbi:MAG: hypothetical protein H3C47_16835, partial [Candidatus Cloacimonetes bacterium]|nr:hypothetical protein [Candidatus Cloacimonadota bacterium]
HEDFEKGVVFGINQGIEKGRQEGQREALKSVVRRMLEAGTPKDTILMATGLSLVELNELLQDLG